jgi:hypothetical protein
MIIKDIVCVGTGFSAFILKLFNKNKIFFISSDYTIIKNLGKYKRRKNLETHIKLFSKKFKSYGKISFLGNNHTTLHDTLINGGNTNYWGGFINTEKVPEKVLNFLKSKNINLIKITGNNQGYFCSNENIHQMRDGTNKILNVSNQFKNCTTGHVIQFKVIKKNSLIKIIFIKNNKLHSVYCKKLFLGIGIMQLLELLLNSNFLKEKDVLTLSEFENKFKLSLGTNLKNTANKIIIKYSFGSAVKHFFGLNTNYFKFLNFTKICIDQIFFNNKKKLFLKIFNRNLIQINKSKKNFGKSIHYCDLCVNKISINKFLKNLSNNIYGISMPFVKQEKPGPISNDIINKINGLLYK